MPRSAPKRGATAVGRRGRRIRRIVPLGIAVKGNLGFVPSGKQQAQEERGHDTGNHSRTRSRKTYIGELHDDVGHQKDHGRTVQTALAQRGHAQKRRDERADSAQIHIRIESEQSPAEHAPHRRSQIPDGADIGITHKRHDQPHKRHDERNRHEHAGKHLHVSAHIARRGGGIVGEQREALQRQPYEALHVGQNSVTRHGSGAHHIAYAKQHEQNKPARTTKARKAKDASSQQNESKRRQRHRNDREQRRIGREKIPRQDRQGQIRQLENQGGASSGQDVYSHRQAPRLRRSVFIPSHADHHRTILGASNTSAYGTPICTPRTWASERMNSGCV